MNFKRDINAYVIENRKLRIYIYSNKYMNILIKNIYMTIIFMNIYNIYQLIYMEFNRYK